MGRFDKKYLISLFSCSRDIILKYLKNSVNLLSDVCFHMTLFSVPLQNHLPDKVDNDVAIGKFCSTGTDVV